MGVPNTTECDTMKESENYWFDSTLKTTWEERRHMMTVFHI
jgi:hypothetical protein